ncbi:sigma-54 interaction domain-containing protein [Paenibacillus sp. GCM10012303]|uniref:sigma-54 interaction domain-containing protein n=1 Tax=Paenibacillus sp. GCM10012303 TaxID=3317340 RepID=UPI0036238376
MLKETKSILIIAHHRAVLVKLAEQLLEIGFDELFHIETRTIDEIDHACVSRFALVLLTSQTTYMKVKPFFSADTSYLIARRVINFSNIREVLSIPPQTSVYLVNNTRDAAEDTIRNLLEMGVSLRFIPYYPGQAARPDITIAVTPGETDYVPDHVETVIDIGDRLIELSTLFEIFHFFRISPQFKNDLLSMRYMQSLFRMVRELSEEMMHSERLQRKLEWVVNSIDDAVVIYSQDEKVQTANEKARQLLHAPLLQVSGAPLREWAGQAFYDAVRLLDSGRDLFRDVDGTAYYIRKTSMNVDADTAVWLLVFRKVEDIRHIEHEYRSNLKKSSFTAKYQFDDILTESPSLLHTVRIARKLALSHSTVLLLGETGTGKEVFAQALHNASPRKHQPFVGINFAALSESLLESELFGYESGAFTGAKKSGHIGVFEQAHLGTLFLDEIGDASPSIQNRLLRALQERQIMKVGGERLLTIDTRVIAATNQVLEQLMEQGKFRRDLYHRLNVLPIRLPPLRERREDIVPLAQRFLREFQLRLNAPPLHVSKAVRQALIDYDWPGNIRELRNVIEYAVHVCEGTIYLDDLPFYSTGHAAAADDAALEAERPESLARDWASKGFLDEMLLILENLAASPNGTAGRPSLLARLSGRLSLSDPQLRYRLKLLAGSELITSGRGRSGARITTKGQRFLGYCLSSGPSP